MTRRHQLRQCNVEKADETLAAKVAQKEELEKSEPVFQKVRV